MLAPIDWFLVFGLALTPLIIIEILKVSIVYEKPKIRHNLLLVPNEELLNKY